MGSRRKLKVNLFKAFRDFDFFCKNFIKLLLAFLCLSSLCCLYEIYLGIETFNDIDDKKTSNDVITQNEEEKEAVKHVKSLQPTVISEERNLNPSIIKGGGGKTEKSTTQHEKCKIKFIPEEHIYLYKGNIEFVSVSKLISYFFRPFDSAYQSKLKAKARGILPGQILEEWDEKGARSKEVGIFMHQQIEGYFKGKQFNKNYPFHYKGKHIDMEENISIEKEYEQFITFLNEHENFIPNNTECMIYDEELKVAGTIDMLYKNSDGTYDIYDWKRIHRYDNNSNFRIVDDWGNPIKESVYHKKGVNGLESIHDTIYWHYCLQQNMYRYILEKSYNIRIRNMYIVVLHADFENYHNELNQLPLIHKIEMQRIDDVIDIIIRACKNENLSTILCSYKN